MGLQITIFHTRTHIGCKHSEGRPLVESGVRVSSGKYMGRRKCKPQYLSKHGWLPSVESRTNCMAAWPKRATPLLSIIRSVWITHVLIIKESVYLWPWTRAHPLPGPTSVATCAIRRESMSTREEERGWSFLAINKCKERAARKGGEGGGELAMWPPDLSYG